MSVCKAGVLSGYGRTHLPQGINKVTLNLNLEVLISPDRQRVCPIAFPTLPMGSLENGYPKDFWETFHLVFRNESMSCVIQFYELSGRRTAVYDEVFKYLETTV